MSNPIYNIDFGLVSERLSPPYKRSVRLLRWLYVLLYPVQWLRNLILGYYADGVTDNSVPFYSVLDSYQYGDMVIGSDDKIYQNVYSGVTPIGTLFDDTIYWLPVLDTYMGIRERLVYNSQTIVLEALLNKKFRVPPSMDPILIDNTDDDLEQIYFYKQSEGYLGVYFMNMSEPSSIPVYLYYELEYIPEFDYIVKVPVSLPSYYPPTPTLAVLPDQLKLVETETRKYNLIDKRFKVEYYPL